MAIGRISLTPTFPLTSSERLGTVVIGILKPSSRWTKLRMTAGGALGIATSVSTGFVAATIAGMSVRRPHLDAVDVPPNFRWVVIDEADRQVDAPLFRISRTIMSPASPAPMISRATAPVNLSHMREIWKHSPHEAQSAEKADQHERIDDHHSAG